VSQTLYCTSSIMTCRIRLIVLLQSLERIVSLMCGDTVTLEAHHHSHHVDRRMALNRLLEVVKAYDKPRQRCKMIETGNECGKGPLQRCNMQKVKPGSPGAFFEVVANQGQTPLASLPLHLPSTICGNRNSFAFTVLLSPPRLQNLLNAPARVSQHPPPSLTVFKPQRSAIHSLLSSAL
jgi:hypothetical protein